MNDPLTLLGRPLPELLALPMAAQFPGLRPGLHRFDAPGGTLTHGAVCRAMSAYLGSEHVANDHGAFPASRYSDALVDWSASRLRALLGAGSGQVVFGPNMTTLTALFLRSRAADLGPGDEVVCTELNHEANIRPWAAWARARGATLRMARISPSGELSVPELAGLVTGRTRWIAVTAASNALGTLCDIPAVTELARAVGARVFVDAVQAVPHRRVEVGRWGCDALVTSAYKWYGPHCGALWLTDETAAAAHLPEQADSAGTGLPGRLQLGTTGFEAVLGTGVAAEVLLGWRHFGATAHPGTAGDIPAGDVPAGEEELAGRLLKALEANPAVRVLGPGSGVPRVPVICFQVTGVPARAVAERLARAGIAVWHGTFYSAPALRALSPADPDAVRAGIAAYTTHEDITALIDAVDSLTGAGR